MATSERSSISIPAALASEWGVSNESLIWLEVGQRRVAIHPSIETEGALKFSPELLNALLLPKELTMSCHFVKERQTLRVGPTIGVIVDAVGKGRRPFGAQTPLLQEIVRLGERVPALVYVFSPGGVSLTKGEIRGLRYIASRGVWIRGTYPIPDVVYNRIPGRGSERSGRVQKTIGRLLANGVKIFNPSYFNKWDTHRWLSSHAAASVYIPDTKLYTGHGVLEEMLDRHGAVYLKPTQGSLGRGIIRIRRRAGHFDYRYDRAKGMTVGGEVSSFEALDHALRPLVRRRQYVVQQGLDLVHFGGSPFDIRVLMQKGATGTWQRSKIFARVAPQGRVTSNLAGGGSAELVSEVLPHTIGRKFKRAVSSRIKSLCRIVPQALEAQTGMTLGELGLDIGIDRNHRVWLIEVNSKPWKKVTTEKGSQEVVERSILRPLLYARWLAGFAQGEGGHQVHG